MKLPILQKRNSWKFIDSNNDIREQFPKFFHYDECVAYRDLFEAVANTLSEFGLDFVNCRGEGYDAERGLAGRVSDFSGIVLQSNTLT